MSQFITSPFEALISIYESIASSDTTPVVVDAEQWVGVAFDLGGCSYIVDMNQVGEVLTKPELTVIPGVKPWVVGVSNIRGRLVPVIDLRAFFRFDHHADARRERVITIEIGDNYLGVLVDQVFGMRNFSASDYSDISRATLNPASNPVHAFVTGQYSNDSATWNLIDLYKLIFSDGFQDVAA